MRKDDNLDKNFRKINTSLTNINKSIKKVKWSDWIMLGFAAISLILWILQFNINNKQSATNEFLIKELINYSKDIRSVSIDINKSSTITSYGIQEIEKNLKESKPKEELTPKTEPTPSGIVANPVKSFHNSLLLFWILAIFIIVIICVILLMRYRRENTNKIKQTSKIDFSK